MDLGDIYQKNIPKHNVNMHGSSGIPIERERDPNLTKLEGDVFSNLNKAIEQSQPKEVPQPTEPQMQVSHIDFEEALKQLAADSIEPVDDKS